MPEEAIHQTHDTKRVAALFSAVVVSVAFAYYWLQQFQLEDVFHASTAARPVVADGSQDHPYERRLNASEYYGTCPSPLNPTRVHEWVDRAAWFTTAPRSGLIFGSVTVCVYCGAHIA